MNNKLKNPWFIYEALKHFKEVGAFCPTSKYTAKKMAEEAVGADIVEFGAGTGVITREILKKLPYHGTLTCFELNEEFCGHLKSIHDRRLWVVNQDAGKFRDYTTHPDTIISAVPLALMQEQEKKEILQASRNIGKFIQIQYNWWSKSMYEEFFKDVRIKLSPFNIPPAFIYVCSNSHI